MIDSPSALLAVAWLLVLSIFTVELCRRDGKRAATEAIYLFEGKTFTHSLLSGLGAVFSVTYFFGATFMYSTVYGAWTLLIAFASFGLAYIIMTRILSKVLAHSGTEGPSDSPKHLLLHYLKAHLDPSHFNHLVAFLACIYFLLLVEEIAISRVIIQSIFPYEPAISTILLSLILLVVLAYLFIGGFRAVLNSDLVQALVLMAFLATLAFYLLLAESPVDALREASTSLPPEILVPSLIAWPLLAVTWLSMSLDFYARLNFAVRKDLRRLASNRLLELSLLGSAIIATVGIIFSSVHASDLPVMHGPAQYFHDASMFFLGSPLVAVRAVFLVSLFAMIFTTVDTLALTVLQISYYTRTRLVRRSNLSLLMLLATLLASVMPSDAVSAVGIFIASLLMPSMFSLVRAMCGDRGKWWTPARPLFLLIVPVVSGATLSPFYNLLEKRFDLMFLIPSCTAAWTIVVLLALHFYVRVGQDLGERQQ